MSQGRDPTRLGSLNFTYEQPDISVDTSARTTKHNLIDDDVVVQKIGREPDTVNISGVCTRSEAKQIDQFVDLNTSITLRSERWSGDVIVTDTATDPMKAKDSNGNWLYDCQITCMEVTDTINTSGEDNDTTGGGGFTFDSVFGSFGF